MHRCLHILEILEGIFDNVGNTATRTTLFNIALTCRVFYEPAIDVLWRSLPDLMPLANLISMYHPNDDVDHPSNINLGENQVSNAWQRIRVYTRRVRELDLGPGVTTRKSRNLLDTVMSFDHLDSPLLPNLRKLVCFEPTMGKYLRPFLQRSLTAFYWRYDGTPYTAALLETLRKADPALKILHLLPSSMKACKQAISVAMERVFQATHHLQYAVVLPTGNTLKHLSLLSSVTRLRLEVYGTADYPAYFSLSPLTYLCMQFSEGSLFSKPQGASLVVRTLLSGSEQKQP
ncbi:hypothetical protein PHLGIDRAFT_446216 [Phlebiopsis gigantea 11061_1 CR5-6]|uniref:F-box domain-containing protein n=1 Tax=Phlebiopsis gigantea (strain 11061_1 CR5-6) TaxID=745531 RepID=A0A0C3NP05_PHLG1|nr:hypothetical protein PHLGIDRAFT_446216 [Phlebiopsis gigantea 11061_1 CR5-6]